MSEHVWTGGARVPEPAEFLARLASREEPAIRELLRRYNRRLFRLARSIVRNEAEAEDVVQEGYLRAFANLEGFRGECDLGSWLGRIVINEALGRLRSRRRFAAVARPQDDEPPSANVIRLPSAAAQIDPERMMAQGEIRVFLERAIDALPDVFRTVLVARLVEEMSVEETAALLGLRPETVKTRLHRARRLLVRTLEQQLGPALTQVFPFEGLRCARMTGAVLKLAANPHA